jgi:hypothetical protein
MATADRLNDPTPELAGLPPEVAADTDAPALERGRARVVAIRFLAPRSVTLQSNGRFVSYLLSDELLRIAAQPDVEHHFTAIRIPGEPARLLRLDPGGFAELSADEASKANASRWEEALRLMAGGVP